MSNVILWNTSNVIYRSTALLATGKDYKTQVPISYDKDLCDNYVLMHRAVVKKAKTFYNILLS